MPVRIFTILCVALLAASCNSKTTQPGFILSTTQLLDSANQVIGIAPAGATVEYIGAGPMPTDVHAGSINVRVDGMEGFMEAALACFGCTPAAILTGTHSPFAMTEVGEFVAYDTLSDGNYHIYQGSRVSAGWIPMSAVSIEPGDVAVAAAIERMDSYLKDDGRQAALQRVAAQYPSCPFLQIIKVDLSEAPDDYLAEQQKLSGLILSKSENRIITTRSMANAWVSKYMESMLLPDEEVGAGARGNYFNKGMLSLPEFVKLPARSIAYSWGMDGGLEKIDAYLLYRMDRSPENISYLYSTFKPLIFGILESGRMLEVHYNANLLVKAYDHIVSIPNHKDKIKKISQEIAQWDREHTGGDGYIQNDGYILADQKDIYQPILNEDLIADAGNDIEVVWFHSFWVRRFGEGNEKVVYDILKELSQMQQQESYTEAGDGDYGDGYDERGDAETGEVDLDAVETYTCIFQEYSIGDCGHLLFSCGDYGDADTSELSKEEKELWDQLVVSTDEGEGGNPDLVGKEFIMKVGTTRGPACNEGQGGEGYVPKILEFRLNN